MFRSHHRQFLATLSVLSLLSVGASDLRSQDLPPQNLPVSGGSGGTSFSRDCGAGRVLTGFRYRKGLTIDAIGLLCRPVLADKTLGPESTIGTLAGGGGGTSGTASCPSGMVIVDLIVKWGSYISLVVAQCRPWVADTRTVSNSSTANISFGGSFLAPTSADYHCESTRQPGSGIRGRSGAFVDALGLVCDEP